MNVPLFVSSKLKAGATEPGRTPFAPRSRDFNATTPITAAATMRTRMKTAQLGFRTSMRIGNGLVLRLKFSLASQLALELRGHSCVGVPVSVVLF